jgi:hypothetical protein
MKCKATENLSLLRRVELVEWTLPLLAMPGLFPGHIHQFRRGWANLLRTCPRGAFGRRHKSRWVAILAPHSGEPRDWIYIQFKKLWQHQRTARLGSHGYAIVPRPQINEIGFTGDHIFASFATLPNWTYRLQGSSSLATTVKNWADLMVIQPQAVVSNFVYYDGITNQQRFYRLLVLP